MKLIQLLAAGAAVAVVPAVAGLVGNPSFSQSVPVPAAQHSAATPATPTAKPSATRRTTRTTTTASARRVAPTTARTTT